MIVVVEAARHRVARDVNIGPAVIVKIGRAHAQAVRARGNPLLGDESWGCRAPGNRDARSLGNILKGSITAITIQGVGPTVKPLRPTSDGQPKIPPILVVA